MTQTVCIQSIKLIMHICNGYDVMCQACSKHLGRSGGQSLNDVDNVEVLHVHVKRGHGGMPNPNSNPHLPPKPNQTQHNMIILDTGHWTPPAPVLPLACHTAVLWLCLVSHQQSIKYPKQQYWWSWQHSHSLTPRLSLMSTSAPL